MTGTDVLQNIGLIILAVIVVGLLLEKPQNQQKRENTGNDGAGTDRLEDHEKGEGFR